MEQLNISPVVEASDAVEELDKNLLVLRLSLGRLQAALERAFAPLANAVLPVVNRAIIYLANFLNDVAAVIGALFGYVQKTAAKTVRVTGSAVKKALADFDEIDRLDFAGGGGSSTVTIPGTVKKLPEELRPIVERIQTYLKPLQEIDFSNAAAAFERLKESIAPIARSLFAGLEWAWFNILVPLARWTIEDALPVFLDALGAALQVLGAIIETAKPLLSWLWENLLKPMAQWAGSALLDGLRRLTELLQGLAAWITDAKPKVEQFTQKLDALKAAFGNLSQGFSLWSAASGGFGRGLQDLNVLAGRLGSSFTGVGASILSVKTLLGGLSGGLVGGIKNASNTAIGMVNGAIRSIQGGVNAMVSTLNRIKITVPSWIPSIGGKSFGMNFSTVSLPGVPYLARGAVLPANKPFLAVVGDQKMGTNVEAPLSVIEDAVANVMGANLQGQDEGNDLLRRILSAIEGITVGDETIGRAARRYESRMARMGGVL